MKKVLIINGHPEIKSLCTELALSYQKGVISTGSSCKLINLCETKFDLVLHHHYHHQPKLEPDLIAIQESIKEADHLVFVYPTWWGTYPALLKGLIDRAFRPDFAFKIHENPYRFDKLLKHKTARLIVTMDTSKWYYYLYYGKPGHRSMKRNILQFCGVNPVRISSFGPVKKVHEIKIKNWLNEVESLGTKLK